MLALIDYAVRGGADAVLLSCSMYGPVAGLARRLHDVPVTGSDEAMFAEVARRFGEQRPAGSGDAAVRPGAGEAAGEPRAGDRAGRPGGVLVLGSLESAAADSARRLRAVAGGVAVRALAAPGAAAAAADRDWPGLTDALARAALPALDGAGLVLLGQYSISPVHAALAGRLGVPVLTPPLMAARALREALA
ncbi:hypothetical protein ACFQ0B_38930 [Nonomuraea thailandensis]